MVVDCRPHLFARAVEKSLRTLITLSLSVGFFPSAWAQSTDTATAGAVSASSPDTGASAPAAVSQAPVAVAPASAALPSAVPTNRLSPPNWAGLSAQQRAVLAPLARDWNELDASRRTKWLELAARFGSVPAEEQARIQERMRSWAKLSPSERQQARAGFQFAQQINADQRQAKWDAYQALPEERRHALAEKAAAKVSGQPASAHGGKANAHPSTAQLSTVNKSNLVPLPSKLTQTPAVAPSVLQARPGVTTVLITQVKVIPSHLGAGLPKVLADPEWVDSKTLLPKQRGVSGIPSPTTSN